MSRIIRFPQIGAGMAEDLYEYDFEELSDEEARAISERAAREIAEKLKDTPYHNDRYDLDASDPSWYAITLKTPLPIGNYIGIAPEASIDLRIFVNTLDGTSSVNVRAIAPFRLDQNEDWSNFFESLMIDYPGVEITWARDNPDSIDDAGEIRFYAAGRPADMGPALLESRIDQVVYAMADMLTSVIKLLHQDDE
jgi:hypothetical protein